MSLSDWINTAAVISPAAWGMSYALGIDNPLQTFIGGTDANTNQEILANQTAIFNRQNAAGLLDPQEVTSQTAILDANANYIAAPASETFLAEFPGDFTAEAQTFATAAGRTIGQTVADLVTPTLKSATFPLSSVALIALAAAAVWFTFPAMMEKNSRAAIRRRKRSRR